MAKHTATPWRVEQTRPIDAAFSIVGADNHAIASILVTSKRTSFEKRANAEFIVRACNAFPALLHAALECVPDLKHYVATHGPGPDVRLQALLEAIKNSLVQP